MNFSQTLKMALKSIGASKMRTFLTMLGIIIGVSAVIVLVSVVNGSSGSITESIESLGANSITVNLRRFNISKNITYEDMNKLKEDYSDLIEYVVPTMSSQNTTVKYESNNLTTGVTGTTNEYLTVKNREVSNGRFVTSIDADERRKVAVIGSYIAQELFGFDDPIDKKIKLNNELFTVIGVLKEISDSEEDSDDDIIIIPYTSGRILFKTNKISNYTLWATSAENVDAAVTAAKNYLYSKLGDEDEYSVISVASMMDALNSITQTMAYLAAGIAGISLIVGGIGIMNIMLVSVTERTREIGIRKAIGAKRSSIMAQFLIEAVVVSSMGGIAGIIVGISGSLIAGHFMQVNAMPNLLVILGTFAFSALIGTFFGWAPASKASKLNPIDALHAD